MSGTIKAKANHNGAAANLLTFLPGLFRNESLIGHTFGDTEDQTQV